MLCFDLGAPNILILMRYKKNTFTSFEQTETQNASSKTSTWYWARIGIGEMPLPYQNPKFS